MGYVSFDTFVAVYLYTIRQVFFASFANSFSAWARGYVFRGRKRGLSDLTKNASRSIRNRRRVF